MNLKQTARRLRREQTDEEKELWRALRNHRFAGFKFRRQHPIGNHILDFYCADAKLDIELDGFQHGSPEEIQHDETRSRFLSEQGIEVLRFWNHQWRNNRDGCLLQIWNALQERTGCIQVLNNPAAQTFVPPEFQILKSLRRTNPSP